MFGWIRDREAAELWKVVNVLETRIEALQLERTERQVAVLNLCEKVLHQLRARDRKRDEENPADVDARASIEALPFRGDSPARRRNY